MPKPARAARRFEIVDTRRGGRIPSLDFVDFGFAGERAA